MKPARLYLLLLPVLAGASARAQTPARQHDTTTLLYAFKKGATKGHFRYFFMATDNEKGLTDYHAHAAGGGLRYETAPFHGFRAGIGGFFVFNIGSSNLGRTDPLSGQASRYETGLFDTENPYNKTDIDRLEELFLNWRHKKLSVTLGKQLLQTPFINLQDGRMRPTGVQGVWAAWQPRRIKVQGGWLWGISPRATTRWYSVAQSIGVYSGGVTANGQKSAYAGHLSSRGLFLLGLEAPAGKASIQVWNQFTENIFNTALLQTGYEQPAKNGSVWYSAAQLIRQDAVARGGHPNPAYAYTEKGGHAWAFSFKTGYKHRRWDAGLHYTRITTAGRLLLPREWGREPFFTFLPRERNEGAGGLHAFMGKLEYRHGDVLKATLAAGYYRLPDVKDYRLNKYGMPSYMQYNAELLYHFHGWLQGLDAQLLLVAKKGTGATYGEAKYVHNKVNVCLYNFVLNYHFSAP